MSVPNSKTGIVNLSLDVIKTENINDVEVPGDDASAVVADRWYDSVRKDILEGFPWNFASATTAIPLSATDPDFVFTDAYELPNDYLSLSYIKFWDYPLSQWNYIIQRGRILMDNGGAESLDIGYTSDVTVVTNFSPSFIIYFAYALAEEIAFKLTGNVSLQKRIEAARTKKELKAKAKNGKANPPVAFRQSKMLNGRRIFGGSRTTGLFTGQNGRT